MIIIFNLRQFQLIILKWCLEYDTIHLVMGFQVWSSFIFNTFWFTLTPNGNISQGSIYDPNSFVWKLFVMDKNMYQTGMFDTI